MILIALVLLIAVGPEQLPGVIRRTGRVVGQLKTMSDNLRRDFNASLDEIERAADVKSWAGPELESTVETVKEAVEPFNFTPDNIDGSTRVADIWSRPPASAEGSTPDGDDETGNETDGVGSAPEPKADADAGGATDPTDADETDPEVQLEPVTTADNGAATVASDPAADAPSGETDPADEVA